jgi:hypothetical protein
MIKPAQFIFPYAFQAAGLLKNKGLSAGIFSFNTSLIPLAGDENP